MRVRMLLAWGCGLCCLAAGWAGAGENARPELPADFLAMVAVKDLPGTVRGAEDYARTVSEALPGSPMDEIKPGDLYRQLLENLPVLSVLKDDAPAYFLVENFMPPSKPAMAVLAKVGELSALAEAADKTGVEVGKPAQDGRPWTLSAFGQNFAAVPRADGWTVISDSPAAVARIAGKLEGWQPATPEGRVELVADIGKAMRLQRGIIDAGIGTLPLILNMQLEQFARKVEEMEANAPNNPQTAMNRSLLEMGRRGLMILGPRSAEMVDAIATAGIVRLRLDVTAAMADTRFDLFPAPGSATEQMVKELAAVKPVSADRLAGLPAEAFYAMTWGDTSTVDSQKLEAYLAGLVGDLVFVMDGKEESRVDMRKATQELFDVGRGETVAAGAVVGNGYYIASADNGKLGAKKVDVLQKWTDLFMKTYLDTIGVLVPQLRGKIEVAFAGEALKDKIEGVGVRTLQPTVKFAPDLEAQFPPEIKKSLDRITANNTNAFATEAVGENLWITASGPAWKAGFAAMVKSAKDPAQGFGKRADFAATFKQAGDRPLLVGMVYPGDALKAILPVAFDMIRQGEAFPEDVRKAIDAIPADPAPFMLAETFGPNQATIQYNISAKALKGFVSTIDALEEGKAFRIFTPPPPPPPAPPQPATEAAQGEFF